MHLPQSWTCAGCHQIARFGRSGTVSLPWALVGSTRMKAIELGGQIADLHARNKELHAAVSDQRERAADIISDKKTEISSLTTELSSLRAFNDHLITMVSELSARFARQSEGPSPSIRKKATQTSVAELLGIRKRRRKRRATFDHHVGIILRSMFFDSDFYLATNPDLRHLGVDIASHYLQHGGFEGRDPGPFFSSAEYLRANADVRKQKINPLLHYELYGRSEGRPPPLTLPLNVRYWNKKTFFPAKEAKQHGNNLAVHPNLEVDCLPDLAVSVSIVIPTHNAGPELYWLVRRLQSQQGLRSIEVVIVELGIGRRHSRHCR